MKKGQVVEEGTHDSLLEDENGVYHALVIAQQLSMDETFLEDADITHEAHKEAIQQEIGNTEEAKDNPKLVYKPRNLISSFGYVAPSYSRQQSLRCGTSCLAIVT